jgi:hypothetical protein
MENKIKIITNIILLILPALFINSCQEGSVFPEYPNKPAGHLTDRGFPSNVGNEWTYLFEDYSKNQTDTVDVIIKDKKVLKNGDTVIFFKTSYRHTLDYLNEKLVHYEYYTLKGDTIKSYIYGNPFEIGEDSIETYNFLVFPLKVGKGWIPGLAKYYNPNYKDTAFAENMVNYDTPSGTFWDIYSIRRLGLYDGGYEQAYYFDPTKGMIAQVIYQKITYQDFTYKTKYNSLELIHFSIK